MKCYNIIVFLWVVFIPQINAQAWAKPKGQGFYKLDYTFIQAKNVFDPGGELVPFRTLGNHTFSFYGEIGITNRWTAFAYVPFLVRNVLNETKGAQTGTILEPGIGFNSVGDTDIGLRYGIVTQPFALSATLLLGLPTGNATHDSGLFTGDGEFNQLLKINAGVGAAKWWLQGGIGFNNRTKNFSDEIRYEAEFGYKFFNDKLLTILKLGGIESTNNGTTTPTSTGLFSNNVEYFSPAFELLYYIKPKWGISFRGAGALKGQNVLAAPSWSFGIFLN